MVAAAAGLCCCCRRSPALHTVESMAGRLAPFRRGGAFTAAISARLLEPLGILWSANYTSTSAKKTPGEEQRLSPSSGPFNGASRRACSRGGDGGGPHGMVAEMQYAQQERGGFARPLTIQWEKDLANAVHLMGNVGREIDLKYLDSGKVLATTSLAVNKGSQRKEEPSWFFLEMWDDLAVSAAQHVAKGEKVYVTGRIAVDKTVKDDVSYTTVKVVVRDLCFVEAYNDRRQPYGQSSDEYVVTGSGSQPQVEVVDSSQRIWNQQQIASQPSQGMKGSSSSSSDAALATEKKWQEYFADPTQWWDNRENKKNPKAPDFKHKSTQEALWIDSWSNPPWVQQQLAVLEEKRNQYQGGFGDSIRSREKKLSSFRDSDFLY